MTKKDAIDISESAIAHYVSTMKVSGDIVVICDNESDAALRYQQLLFFSNHAHVFYLPAWDSLPFDRISPSVNILAERAMILAHLSDDSRHNAVIILSASALLQKIPSCDVFMRHSTILTKGMEITHEQISSILISNGFLRSNVASSPQEFAIKGEILDIIISHGIGYRVNFIWNKIDSIKTLDPITQKSLSAVDSIKIHPVSELNLCNEYITRFKENFITQFGVNSASHPLYLAVSEGRHFAAIENLIPLFYDKMFVITDYLKNPMILMEKNVRQTIDIEYQDIVNLHEARVESNAVAGAVHTIILPHSSLYFSAEYIARHISQYDIVEIQPGESEKIYQAIPNFYYQSLHNSQLMTELLLEFCALHKDKKIVICCACKSAIERIRNIIDTHCHNLRYTFAEILIDSGFVTSSDVFISQYELLGRKENKKNKDSSKQLKTILSEMENLVEGDLVSHREYGIGMFSCIETITISDIPHDCVRLLYADGDRLYVPVENLDCIKRYGSNECALDKLGNVAWQRRKAKLKDRIGDLAHKLINIAAERKRVKVDPIFPSDRYHEFAEKFPYSETDDQMRAIDDIIADFEGGYPMDRLICGDVGFGKTEVAMRAAFLVAASGKQVAVIAPTTILSRQHYTNFVERFSKTGIRIAQISRLVTNSVVAQNKIDTRNGDIDILIGTHAILSKDVAFHDLGLVIVDEEQHFGVLQKERIKEIKSGIHVLSLSATPIPRTLQMSLLGVRDLSLIATPPVDRLSIRTAVINYDPVIIRDALMREYLRGGRSFYVCPRISDIEEIESKLKVIVPELKFKATHGKMPPLEIEKIMSEFYDGKLDILLSTAIIESGIDLPDANTMIIHKAEIFGLSQLYQLRGRIGRGKIRGYAYLTTSSRNITKQSSQRLDIIQNLDTLGAGFSIASHDMDIRGFGNLVGDEQSGHIKEVGIELYQDMLEEAMLAIKGEMVDNVDINPTININIPILLPESYVCDNDLRMTLYKRISTIELKDDIESFRDELVDRFGPVPREVNNLLEVVYIKSLCKKLNIQNLDSGPNGIVLKFYEPAPIDMLMRFIDIYPRNSKIKPDCKFVIMRPIDAKNVIAEVNNILSEMIQLL